MRALTTGFLMLISFTTQADIMLEAAKSIRPNQYLGAVKYRKNFELMYVEGGIGGWGASRATAFAHLQAGVHYKNISIGVGPALINQTSERLGSNLQFLSSLTFTLGCNNQYYIKYSHVSNAARVTGLKRPNGGEDFISVGYIIKL